MNERRAGWSAHQEQAPARPLVNRDAGYLLRRIPLFTALFTCVIATAVLVGWWFDIPVLEGLVPGLSTMKVNNALCLLFIGLAVWARVPVNLSAARLWISRITASIAALLSLLTLLEYSSRSNFGIDQLLIKDLAGGAHPGRPGTNTAAALFSLAMALLCLELQGRVVRYVSLVFEMISGLLSTMAVLGYVYSLQTENRLTSYTRMAVHTAICILLLSLGAISLKTIPGLTLLREQPEVHRILVQRLMVTNIFVRKPIALRELNQRIR